MIRSQPADPALWHHWHCFLPVKTIYGEWTIGDVWRKLDGAKRLYQRRPMSEEESADLTTY